MNLDKVIHAIEMEELSSLATDISNLFIRAAKPHKHAAMMKVHDSVRDTSQKIYKTAIDKTLADAQAEVMSNLHAHNTKLGGRMGQRLGQAIKTKPGPNAEAIHGAKPDTTSLIFDLDGFTTKFLDAMNTAGRQAYLFTSKGLLSHLGQNETATDSGVVRDFLINRQNKISGCPQIIFDQIMDSLNEGVDGGETMPELAARVQDEFEGISKTRATLIAQTESQCCYGMAQLGALDTAGVEKKQWVTMEDSLVRPTHQDAEDDGAIDADDEFSNGLRCPGDMDGDASEVCNCRCYLAPVEVDEKDLESELSELEDAIA